MQPLGQPSWRPISTGSFRQRGNGRMIRGRLELVFWRMILAFLLVVLCGVGRCVLFTGQSQTQRNKERGKK